MQITKDVLISDVIIRVTQSKPSADLEIEKAQVAFVLDQVRWGLITDKINKQFAKLYQIDPVYIFTEDNLVPVLTPRQGAVIQDNISINLQFAPLNIYRDRGVIRVFANPVVVSLPQPNLQFTLDYGSPVEMITAFELDVIRKLKFSKPSLNNLKFRREGQNLIIYGLDVNTYKMVNFSVTYFPRISMLEDLNDNDPVPLTEDLYGPLVEGATEIIFNEMYKTFADIRSDATQMTNYSDNRTNDKTS